MERKALVIGATGLVGKQLVKQLLEAKEYSEVHVFVRRPIDQQHEKQTVHIVNFDQISKSEFPHVDDIFICIGTTIKQAKSKKAFRKVDFDYPVSIATYAKEKGASRLLVISAIGANAESNVFYSRIKGEMEEAIKKIGYPHVDIFRPSLLLGDRPEFRLGEKMGEYGMILFRPFLLGPLSKYRAIKDKTVARAMYQRAISEDRKSVTVIESVHIQKLGQ
ncbi:oxidoreductase [Bacillus sp. FJAT-45037]|uniref:oxidoreductase n=1 Tax=Bacillus sp. FJAT-45037 TaxID=2011007 RepID=UPI000C24671B|nr:oxidoreductase [Bacillus sp. FJAT-45037]